MIMFKGIAASKGIGIGRVLIVKEQDLTYEARTVIDTQAEAERFSAAVAKFTADTEIKAENIEKSVGQKEAEIIRGHILMIQDPLSLIHI